MSELPGSGTPALPILVRQLERSQWASPDSIVSSQLRHLVRLAEHGQRSSPAFAARLACAGLTPHDLADRDGLAALPLLTRRDIQRAGADLFCTPVPEGHGGMNETTTSGSTGEPVTVRTTDVSILFWHAMAMREQQWHRRDLTGRLCAIDPRVASYERRAEWGAPASVFTTTGPALRLPIATATAQLASWVADFSPTFLVIYPSTLEVFTGYCRRHGIALPDLHHILTVGETLPEPVRAGAQETFSAAVADLYSSQEFGHIALECPVSGLYHVMSESVLVEVLDDRGGPCQPGDIGRVVISDLHNYSTPLVRYEIGDHAEVGSPCPCGRGLPTLKRIAGRERNLMRMPDGTRRWALTGFLHCRQVAPVVQYQLIQQGETTIDARLVVERPLLRTEENALQALLQEWAGCEFVLRFHYFDDRLPNGTSGKFESFICNVPEPALCPADA
ncbi:MAG TPA: hypothetical protein VI485_01760 [Vicinamibacterales bacterium]|nr:hypothetical protein [Vicinamibacterales bacterium]